MSRPVDAKLVHFPELGYAVAAWPYDRSRECHVVEFEAFETLWMTEVATGREHVTYQKRDAPTHPEPVESIDEAQVFVSGSVRFDGCANLRFVEQDKQMLHFCGRKAAVNIGELMGKIYDVVHGLLIRPDWDGTTLELPDDGRPS